MSLDSTFDEVNWKIIIKYSAENFYIQTWWIIGEQRPLAPLSTGLNKVDFIPHKVLKITPSTLAINAIKGCFRATMVPGKRWRSSAFIVTLREDKTTQICWEMKIWLVCWQEFWLGVWQPHTPSVWACSDLLVEEILWKVEWYHSSEDQRFLMLIVMMTISIKQFLWDLTLWHRR